MTPATLPNYKTVDTSDEHYAAVLTAAYEAHERFVASDSAEDLRAWVELDRERAAILEARQIAKAGQS
jgi:hypothetical protein